MTSPLPDLQNDPAVVRGNTVKNNYTVAVQVIRGNSQLSDIGQGQQIAQAWQAANAGLVAAYQDLRTRYQARSDALLAKLPLGPAPVAPGTSPADEALLLQIFRNNVEQARNAAPDDTTSNGNIGRISPAAGTLSAMLADAQKFNDDSLLRAVMTVAWETGNITLVRSWCDANGLSDLLDETAQVQQVLANNGFSSLWITPALSLIDEPAESVNLPRLVAAAQAAVVDANRASQSSAYRR